MEETFAEVGESTDTATEDGGVTDGDQGEAANWWDRR